MALETAQGANQHRSSDGTKREALAAAGLSKTEAQRAMVAQSVENSTWGGDRRGQDANLHLDRGQAAEMFNVSEPWWRRVWRICRVDVQQKIHQLRDLPNLKQPNF